MDIVLFIGHSPDMALIYHLMGSLLSFPLQDIIIHIKFDFIFQGLYNSKSLVTIIPLIV